MTKDEALKLALYALVEKKDLYLAQLILEKAIEQAEKQEPVAWMSPNKERLEFSRKDTVYGSHTTPLYTAPPKQEFVCSTGLCHYKHWVGLTDEEILNTADFFGSFQYGDAQGHKRLEFARAIEQRLKEKNRD